jgi:hypothetical protein
MPASAILLSHLVLAEPIGRGLGLATILSIARDQSSKISSGAPA